MPRGRVLEPKAQGTFLGLSLHDEAIKSSTRINEIHEDFLEDGELNMNLFAGFLFQLH